MQKQYEKSKTFTAAFDTYIFKDKQNEFFSKYSVYVIYVYTKKVYPNDTCYTVGLIKNGFMYSPMMPEYFSYYKKNLVVFRFSDDLLPYNEDGFKIEPIDSNNYKVIMNRLFPIGKGGFTGSAPGLTLRKSKGELFIRYYYSMENIPRKYNILVVYPEGGSLELIKDGNNRILPDRK
jgi:hypothetical protein